MHAHCGNHNRQHIGRAVLCAYTSNFLVQLQSPMRAISCCMTDWPVLCPIICWSCTSTACSVLTLLCQATMWSCAVRSGAPLKAAASSMADLVGLGKSARACNDASATCTGCVGELARAACEVACEDVAFAGLGDCLLGIERMRVGEACLHGERRTVAAAHLDLLVHMLASNLR